MVILSGKLIGIISIRVLDWNTREHQWRRGSTKEDLEANAGPSVEANGKDLKVSEAHDSKTKQFESNNENVTYCIIKRTEQVVAECLKRSDI